MNLSRLLRITILTVALVGSASAATGQPADFTLAAATGSATFKLSEARGKYVALHFLLKTECPVCLRHTRDYFTKAPTLPNVVQVFVKPDTDAEIKAWAGKLPADELAKNPIYRDPDAKLAKAFNIPDGYKFHGQVVHFPATVLLDPTGKEAFATWARATATGWDSKRSPPKSASSRRPNPKTPPERHLTNCLDSLSCLIPAPR